VFKWFEEVVTENVLMAWENMNNNGEGNHGFLITTSISGKVSPVSAPSCSTLWSYLSFALFIIIIIIIIIIILSSNLMHSVTYHSTAEY